MIISSWTGLQTWAPGSRPGCSGDALRDVLMLSVTAGCMQSLCNVYVPICMCMYMYICIYICNYWFLYLYLFDSRLCVFASMFLCLPL